MLDLGGMLAARFRTLRARLRGERLAISRQRSTADSVAQGAATLAIFGTVCGPRGRHGAPHDHRRRLRPLLPGVPARTGCCCVATLNNLANLYEGSLFLGDLFEFLDLDSGFGSQEFRRFGSRDFQGEGRGSRDSGGRGRRGRGRRTTQAEICFDHVSYWFTGQQP